MWWKRKEPVRVDEPGVGLADALEVLRAELASARLKAAGQDVQFPVQTLTVELKAGITRSADGKVGFTVPFIGAELGGSTGYQRESVQTVTLVLGPPVDRDGIALRVASRADERKD